MSIRDAMRFLDDLDDLAPLRSELYRSDGLPALFERLAAAGYRFSGGEFEEAVDHLHVGCASAEAADVLMNKVHWFRMLAANA